MIDDVIKGILPAMNRRKFLGLVAGSCCFKYSVAKSQGSYFLPIKVSEKLKCISALTIPKTATEGALETQTHLFVEKALITGIEETDRTTADRFFAALDRYIGTGFMSISEEQQKNIMEEIDSEVFSDDEFKIDDDDIKLWKKIKSLILIGYYTSQTGASVELNYVPVPGNYVPDLPVEFDTRAYSSDWTGVKFG